MRKKILALLLMICISATLMFDGTAYADDVFDENVVYLADGSFIVYDIRVLAEMDDVIYTRDNSQTICGEKTASYYDASGNELFRATLSGTFRYTPGNYE